MKKEVFFLVFSCKQDTIGLLLIICEQWEFLDPMQILFFDICLIQSVSLALA